MSQAELAPSEPLEDLARRANDAHKAFRRGAGEALAHAIEAGTALGDAKRRMAFGEWLPWVARHVEFSERTARLYMQLAAHPDFADRQRVADLSLRAAAKLIGASRAAPGAPTAVAAGPHLAAGESKPQRALATAQRVDGDSPLDPEHCARVREVLGAIAALLARAESGELPAPARAKLLHEAAAAAGAMSGALQALADQLDR